MSPEDIAAFRTAYGDKLPASEVYFNTIGDSTETLDRLDAIFAEKGILPLSKAQRYEIRLCFIYRTVRAVNQLACLARAGFNVDEIADGTPADLTKFINEQIHQL
jgi:hypothetical protein